MTSSREPLTAFESDIEDARARLAGTIDQLAYRAHPKTIMRRQWASFTSNFVDERGVPRTDTILKIAGGVVGFAAVVVVIRKVTR